MENISKKIISVLLCAIFAFLGSGNDAMAQRGLTELVSKTDAEIDGRAQKLAEMLPKIDAMKRLSPENKRNLKLSVQQEIDSLKELKAEIDAETSLADVKAIYQSVAKSYKIHALIMQKIAVVAAAEKVLQATSLLNNAAGKAQTRINALPSGKNKESLQKYFKASSEAIARAANMSNEAIAQALALSPDGGDKAKMQQNIALLKATKEIVKNASAELKLSRKNLGEIAKQLKKISPKSSPKPETTETPIENAPKE